MTWTHSTTYRTGTTKTRDAYCRVVMTTLSRYSDSEVSWQANKTRSRLHFLRKTVLMLGNKQSYLVTQSHPESRVYYLSNRTQYLPYLPCIGTTLATPLYTERYHRSSWLILCCSGGLCGIRTVWCYIAIMVITGGDVWPALFGLVSRGDLCNLRYTAFTLSEMADYLSLECWVLCFVCFVGGRCIVSCSRKASIYHATLCWTATQINQTVSVRSPKVRHWRSH